MSKQTALMELKQWVDDNYPNFNKADIEAKIDELFPKERQDIIEAHDKGMVRYCQWEPDRHGNESPTGLDYFTNTFNQ